MHFLALLMASMPDGSFTVVLRVPSSLFIALPADNGLRILGNQFTSSILYANQIGLIGAIFSLAKILVAAPVYHFYVTSGSSLQSRRNCLTIVHGIDEFAAIMSVLIARRQKRLKILDILVVASPIERPFYPDPGPILIFLST